MDIRFASLPRTFVALGILTLIAVAASACFGSSVPHDSSVVPTEPENPHLAGFTNCADGIHNAPWKCSTVDVPRDRDDPSSGTITLTVFAIPHSDMSTPEGPPLFTTPGGPGARGIDNYALWLLPGLIRQHHDVVSLDPRGTGLSDAIDCPGVADAAPTVAAYVATVTACGARLGEASDLYGGAQRAMDVEALREKLGYDRIVFYGGSYGGVDVQAYAARHPDRLAGLVIDGGFIVEDRDTFFGTPVAADAVVRVDAACAASAECAASTGDPAAVLARLLKTLSADPLTQDGRIVADEMSVGILIDQGLGADVIAAALALEAGDPSPLAQLSAENGAVGIPAADSDDPTVFSAGAQVAGWCNDGYAPWDVAASLETRRAQLDAMLQAMPEDAFAPWSKTGWREYRVLDQCLGWPAPGGSESILTAGPTITGVPALLLVGDQDGERTLTRALRGRFPESQLVLVPGAGHPALSVGQCAAEFVAEFVETLAVPAGTPCG